MISTSDLHLLGCHFEQETLQRYPSYEKPKSKASINFPVVSFGFVFVLLGITCKYPYPLPRTAVTIVLLTDYASKGTVASIGIFRLFTHTHYALQHQDADMLSTWSSRFMQMPTLPQSKSVTNPMMGFAFIEVLSRKDLASKWRNALESFEFKLEVESMPLESAVLGLEDWIYNVAKL